MEKEEAKKVINKLWYFLFGYATMLCTRLDEDYRKNETDEVIENKISEIAKYFQMKI